jgi:O-antigen ligase
MKFLRFAICALLAFAVLAHGGVEDWARAVIETGSGLLFLAWAVLAYFNSEEQIVIPSILPPLAAFALVVLGQWLFHATVSAYNTRTELFLLLANVILLFVAAQVFRTTDDWRFFVWFIMGFGFLVAIFGILQHLTFNRKLYWFREMRYGGIPFGPYVNRNHFAGFAEMVIPVALIPLIMGKVRRERRFIVGFLAVLPICALFFSASRGGMVSFAVELAILAAWTALRRSSGKHMLVGGAVLAAALVMVSWLGVHEILQRFSSMQSLEVTSGKRAAMRAGTWHIFLDHPWVGTGLGTFEIVFPRYETLYDGMIVNHAHNDFLEALAETGLAGALCCAWFIAVLFWDSLRSLSPRSQSFASALHLSGLVACCGLLTHSLVDFNLHLPANALLFFFMAYLASADITSTRQQPRPGYARHGNR